MTKKNDDKIIAAPKLYTTLKHEASAEFIEKKSRFIGYAKPVATEDEALEFIKAIRSKHADATHNVFAYHLRGGAIARYSDDGEPQGTAGIPVLDVIKKSGADDCAVVVTRYFGGTLLGAGGLVRAYAKGAKIAIDAAEVVTYELYTEFYVICDYSAYQKIVAELYKYEVITDSTDFGAEITLKLAVRSTRYPEYVKRLSELFAGRITPIVTGERFDCQ
jgi:uncharacterized YigZ family protein